MLSLLPALVLVLPAVSQEREALPVAGLPTAELIAAFDSRDVEGRWVLTSKWLATHDTGEVWIKLAGLRRDLELLEWSVLYGLRPWGNDAGAKLFELDAPHWPRLALWVLGCDLDAYGRGGFVDSHVRDAARHALEARPQLVLAWSRLHGIKPEDLPAEMGASLQEKASESEEGPFDVGHYLAPHKRSAVLAPLYWTEPLVEFGERLSAQPGEFYVHQVVRALNALSALQAPASEELAALRRLSEHPHPAVRREALLTWSFLPTDRINMEFLWERAQNARLSDVDRRAAVTALGHGPDALAYDMLLRIGLDLEHPSRANAWSRLGDLDQGFFWKRLDTLEPVDESDVYILARTKERIANRTGSGQLARLSPANTAKLLERVGVAELRESPLAKSLGEWSETLIDLAGTEGFNPTTYAPGAGLNLYLDEAELIRRVQSRANRVD